MQAELAEACADLRNEQRNRCPTAGSDSTTRHPGLDLPSLRPCDPCLENIPVLSYLLLRGRCGNCLTPISMRYPWVEAVTGLLSLGVVMHFGATPAALAALVLWAWSHSR